MQLRIAGRSRLHQCVAQGTTKVLFPITPFSKKSWISPLSKALKRGEINHTYAVNGIQKKRERERGGKRERKRERVAAAVVVVVGGGGGGGKW